MNELPMLGEEAVGVSPKGTLADWAGMIASIGCAIHCAAMPMALAYLPALGLTWLADEGFHKWMAVLCFGLAAAAFVPGWRKHGSLLPAMWGAAGLVLLTSAAFGLEGQCCPSCTTSSSNTVARASCSDAACASCQSTPAVESASDSTLAQVAPFVTPLGGVLLVVGHVTNRRKSCTCQGDVCCVPGFGTERDV